MLTLRNRRPTAVPAPQTAIRLLLFAVLACALATAACGAPGRDPQPGQVFASLRITGGIAARDITITVTGDGIVQQTGMPARLLTGGAAGAAELQRDLVASGIYASTPGRYLPLNPCCDRQTYDLTVTRDAKVYAFTTMDGTDTAPAPLIRAITLVQEYANAAK